QVAAAAVSTQGNQVYVGTDTGDLSWLRFDTEGGADGETTRLNLVEDGINALGFVFGDVSLVVADRVGNVRVYFPARSENGFELRHFADIDPHRAAVSEVGTSSRNKMILTRNEKGDVHLDYLTSRR